DRLVRSRIAGAGANLLRGQIMTAHGAEAARARHGGDQLGGVDRSHAAERDRMIDLQEVADRRSDHDSLFGSKVQKPGGSSTGAHRIVVARSNECNKCNPIDAKGSSYSCY